MPDPDAGPGPDDGATAAEAKAREVRYKDDVAREYRDGRIAVQWRPQFCIHVASCIRAQPGVFDPMRRPWIVLDGADPDDVAAAVVSCPTGALSFERLDGGEQEPQPADTVVVAVPNGPLFVNGPASVVDGEGERIRDATRIALCRCGASANKPFCDGTHRSIGFRAP